MFVNDSHFSNGILVSDRELSQYDNAGHYGGPEIAMIIHDTTHGGILTYEYNIVYSSCHSPIFEI